MFVMKTDSIYQNRLQLVSTGMIGALNQIDQFENAYHLLKCGWSIFEKFSYGKYAMAIEFFILNLISSDLSTLYTFY